MNSFRNLIVSWPPFQVLSTLLRPSAAREAFRVRRWERAMGSAAMVRRSAAELRAYVPVSFVSAPEPAVVWLREAERRHAPFYSQTNIRSWEAMKRPKLFRTPFEDLKNLVVSSPGLRPSGFIYQLSRCGSTLISNMLAAYPDTLVVSESDPVNDLLASGLPVENHLAPLLSALGRTSACERFFVKFTSWNVLRLAAIQELFPSVPWIFVYRDPVEVLVSNLAQRGGWMGARANPAHPLNVLCLDGADPRQMTEAEYGARILGAFCRAALQTTASRHCFIEYSEIQAGLPKRICEFFGLQGSPAIYERMLKPLNFYSKDGRQKRKHKPDAQRKRNAAGPDVRDAASRFIAPVYEQLRNRSIAAGASAPRTANQ